MTLINPNNASLLFLYGTLDEIIEDDANRETIEFDRLLSWADFYDTCSFETKKMFISQFIKSVRVSRGYNIEIDCRPSDAIALAVRTGVPILADEKVLETASTPDFNGVEHDEKERDLERFHDFVSSLSPEDFSTSE